MAILTEILRVDPLSPDPTVIARAAQAILAGQVVAFPTETVYGLGANALDERAVQRIFTAKQRPQADPLIVHLAAAEDLPRVAQEIPPLAQQLAASFWPGPLTLILPKLPQVPDIVTAGLDTVAVRVPAHPVALALLCAAGTPIAAPSANLFGSVSPTTAQHVLADLSGRIDLILDGGSTAIGVESTVLDISQTPPLILRPGGVSREALESLIGAVQVHAPQTGKESGESLLPQVSPGLFDKHYAPRAALVLVWTNSTHEAHQELRRLAQDYLAAGTRVGALIVVEDEPVLRDLSLPCYLLGSEADLTTVARRLYAGLRALDAQGVQIILARDFGEQGLGLAIRDRLRRAASRVVRPGARDEG